MNLGDLQTAPHVAMLPQQKFLRGGLFSGQKKWREVHWGEVVVVHNNWIRFKKCKLLRWLLLGLWRGAWAWTPYFQLIMGSSGKHKGKAIHKINWKAAGIPEGILPTDLTDCSAGNGGGVVLETRSAKARAKSTHAAAGRRNGLGALESDVLCVSRGKWTGEDASRECSLEQERRNQEKHHKRHATVK